MQNMRVLLVDDNNERAGVLSQALLDAGFQVVGALFSSADLTRVVEEKNPDIILVDIASPGRDTLEQLGCIYKNTPRAIALFTHDERPETIRAALEAGVSAYSAGDLQPSKVRAALEVAVAQFERYQRLQAVLDEARQCIADRKHIDRAKGFIMSRRKCDEPQAYQLLQKMAMDRRKKLAEVARDVVAMADILGNEEAS
jgi:response regulator NasT